MHDMMLWLLLADALVVAMITCRGMVRSSLVPVRISSQLAQAKANRSR